MKIQSYKDLIVWQKSIDLVDLVYDISNKLPKEEIFGLKSQITRCSVSIPSNIAEGYARGTKKDYLSFLRIAKGSLNELETQLIICNKRYKLQNKKLDEILIEVSKMLTVLIKKLNPTP